MLLVLWFQIVHPNDENNVILLRVWYTGFDEKINSEGHHSKNITVEFINECIISSNGLVILGAILGKNNFVKNYNKMKVDCSHH